MTPEEASHHEWLNEIQHQRPAIVDRPRRSAVTVNQHGDGCYGKVYHQSCLLTKDIMTAWF